MARILSERFRQGFGRPRLILWSVLAVAQTVLVGCDPGMLIHQVGGPAPRLDISQSPERAEPSVTVDVRSTMPLVHFSSYDTDVRIHNATRSPVLITGIELNASNKSYADQAFRSQPYPLSLKPEETVVLNAAFNLDENLWRTFFRKPAEIVVHYRLGDDQRIAKVTIVGAHLDGSR